MQYGLVHIAAGDLLREEIAAGTEKGKRAKEYMEKGSLVPSEIVVMVCEWSFHLLCHPFPNYNDYKIASFCSNRW